MIRRMLRSDRGTAVVEFGLVAPVLIFLAVLLVDVGRYVYYGIVIQHSARAGLQYQAQTLITAADAVGTQRAALADAPSTGVTVTPSYYCALNGSVTSCITGGSSVVYFAKVQVTGTFHPLWSYPGIPSSIPITATSVMRVTNQ